MNPLNACEQNGLGTIDNCSPSAALSFVEIHFENAGCVASYVVASVFCLIDVM